MYKKNYHSGQANFIPDMKGCLNTWKSVNAVPLIKKSEGEIPRITAVSAEGNICFDSMMMTPTLRKILP